MAAARDQQAGGQARSGTPAPGVTRPSPMVSLVKTSAACAERHARLDHADEQPADDVDQRDHDAGDGVAADELAGTVHGPEEVGLLGDFLRGGAGPRARR